MRIPNKSVALPGSIFPLIATVLLSAGSVAARPSPGPQNAPALRELQRAVALAESGHAAEAMDIDARLLKQNPRFAPALKLKGMLLEDAGQNAEAGAAYEQAYQLAPRDPDLLLKTGIYQLVTGHPSQAGIRLSRYTHLQPQDADAWFYLAQALHLTHNDKAALAAMARSAKLAPNNPVVLQKYGELLSSTGDYQSSLQWLLKAQAADPKLAGLDYDLGNADFNLMDLPNAELNLARAVDLQPENASALELLGETQIRLSKWNQAQAAFSRLLALRPDDLDGLLGLGQAQLALRNYPAATDTFTHVLAIDPTRFKAHFYLSRVYGAEGKTKESQHEARLHELMMEQMTFVESAVREQRENEIRDQARALLRKHDVASVVRLYRAHFQDSNVSPGAPYVFIGKTYLFVGETDQALQAFGHALTIEPKVHGAHTYEGILALKNGDLAGAERQFRAELANDPNYQMAIAEMGEVRYHQQKWTDAATWLSKSRTMSPELLYMLCESYFHLGEIDDANLNAEAAAAYGRNDTQFMHGLIELLQRNKQTALANQLAAYIKP